jgi:uncharacterized protein YbjT (DUF2867 family)
MLLQVWAQGKSGVWDESPMKLFLLAASLSSASGLSINAAPRRNSAVATRVTDMPMYMDRRSLLASTIAASTAFASTEPALAADKVVVLGGSGYVGAYASQMLLQQGYEVVSVSRAAPAAQADKVKAILGAGLSGSIKFETLDVLEADLSGVLAGASGVISCVGVAPGGSNQRDGNGKANVKIADAVKAAGIRNFVYIGVASELSNGPIKFIFGDYVKGKAEAVGAVNKDFGASALILQPGIIAGGPPGEVRPPGPPGMTPVPVEAVAKAAVAGALGKKSGVVDGNNAIASMASAL